MPKTAEAFIEHCRRQHLRVTGPRRAIANVIAASTDHPDAFEIFQRVAATDPGISLATVYRTLKLFSQHGLIERHSFEGGRARVERAAERHHDHLIDVTTNKIIEFRSDEIERLQADIAKKLGYQLTGHRLELYGRPIERAKKRR